MTDLLTLPILDGLDREAVFFDQVKSGARRHATLIWQADTLSYVAPRAMQTKLAGSFADATARGWTCVIRSTGGDLVPQGPGILNYTMCFRRPKTVHSPLEQNYLDICAPLIATLATFGVTAELGRVDGSYCDGDYNVNVDGLKLAGTAQRLSTSRDGANEWVVLGHAMMPLNAAVIPVFAGVNELYAEAGIHRVIAMETATTIADLGIDEDAFVAALGRELEDRFPASES